MGNEGEVKKDLTQDAESSMSAGKEEGQSVRFLSQTHTHIGPSHQHAHISLTLWSNLSGPPHCMACTEGNMDSKVPANMHGSMGDTKSGEQGGTHTTIRTVPSTTASTTIAPTPVMMTTTKEKGEGGEAALSRKA